jgi:hypothetical protein
MPWALAVLVKLIATALMARRKKVLKFILFTAEALGLDEIVGHSFTAPQSLLPGARLPGPDFRDK